MSEMKESPQIEINSAEKKPQAAVLIEKTAFRNAASLAEDSSSSSHDINDADNISPQDIEGINTQVINPIQLQAPPVPNEPINGF